MEKEERNDLIEGIILEILSSPKYRSAKICEATIRDVVYQESRHYKKKKLILDSSKKKLHNIVAEYLGDLDYEATAFRLDQVFRTGESKEIQNACLEIMHSHASTSERIPFLKELYEVLFGIMGIPTKLMDIACGLHPFSLPWMNLQPSVDFFAYDINLERINLINSFFKLIGIKPYAEVRDALVKVPNQQVDLALIFKEVHRFEQRKQGSSRFLINSLKAKWICVSLPITNLTHKTDMSDSFRRFFYNKIALPEWNIQEVVIGNELFFCIRRGD
jgi:16S rRNA (guanine(1405)-N(7))-methyltransferase